MYKHTPRNIFAQDSFGEAESQSGHKVTKTRRNTSLLVSNWEKLATPLWLSASVARRFLLRRVKSQNKFSDECF